jgi:hypothetical protein
MPTTLAKKYPNKELKKYWGRVSEKHHKHYNEEIY